MKLQENNFQIEMEVQSNKTECYIMINNKLVHYVAEMKQLRKDWLLIYGLYEI